MFKRAVVGGLMALTLIGAGVAIGVSVDGDWGHRDAIVVSGGTGSGAADAGQTIVIRDGHYGPGLFGLFFVLLILFFVLSAFKRGGRGRGHWKHGGPGSTGGPAWLEDWHRRAHESEASRSGETPEQG